MLKYFKGHENPSLELLEMMFARCGFKGAHFIRASLPREVPDSLATYEYCYCLCDSNGNALRAWPAKTNLQEYARIHGLPLFTVQ